MCCYMYQNLNIKYFQYISIFKNMKNIIFPFTTSLLECNYFICNLYSYL